MQVERRNEFFPRKGEELVESGKRVSNTWIICLLVGDNSAKAGLIPHKTLFRKEGSQRFSEQSGDH